MANFTDEEVKAFSEWIIRMIKFWSVSALLYFAIFDCSVVAVWILASLIVMKYMEKVTKEVDNDKNN